MKHQQEGQSWSKNKINWADNERTKLEKVKSSRPCSTVSFPWWDKIFPREFTVMSKDPSLTVNTISQSTTFPSVIKTYKLYRKSSSKFNQRKKEKKICFFCDEFIIFWMDDFRREEKQHNFVQLNVNSTLSNQIENVEVEINQNNFNYREQEISSDEIGHSLHYWSAWKVDACSVHWVESRMRPNSK